MAAGLLRAQPALSWEDVKQKFRINNATRQAGVLTVEEFQASEITAGLRPNPVFSSTEDQNNFFSTNPYRPLGAIQWTQSISQLYERKNKRQRRIDSATIATSIAGTDLQDLDRNLLFALRDAFVRVLQGKAVLEMAEENLRYYDKVLAVNRERQSRLR